MRTNYAERYRLMGLRIACYRRRAGCTQERFAEAIGCSLNFLAQIEGSSITKGVSLEILFRICGVLGIQPGKLLDEE